MKRLSVGLALALTFLVAFALLGCGGETTTTTVAGGAAGDERGPLGEPIVLGVPTALGSIEGADALRAVEMATEEINAKGGVDVGGTRRPFKVASIDTREHEPGVPTNDALAAIEKLITESKPAAIVGGAFRSEVLLASMDLIAKNKIPTLVGIAMTPEFEKKIGENPEEYKYFFRTALNAPFLVNGLARTMLSIQQQFGFGKMYIVHQDVLWAQGTAGGLAEAATEAGWEVVGTDAYPTGASDFSSSLNKAKQAGAEVIVPIFDMPQSGTLLKQARSMRIPALIAGFISPLAPATAWDATNGEVEGMVNFLFEPASLPLDALPKTVEFYKAFEAKYGKEQAEKLSGHGPGPSYDAVYVLAAAIEKAGSVDPEALVPVIASTEMDGVIGHIKFNENHQVIFGTDPATEAISIAYQWIDGERVPVFPEAAAAAKIVLPEALQ